MSITVRHGTESKSVLTLNVEMYVSAVLAFTNLYTYDLDL